MGDSGVYPDDYPAQLPVCDSRWADCSGDDQDISQPVPDPEVTVLWGNVHTSPLFLRADGILCGAYCGRNRGLPVLLCVFLCIQEIFKREGEAEGYQAVKRNYLSSTRI